MQPSDAITLLEVVLRDVIREFIQDDWTQDQELNLGRIKGTRDAEVAKRAGVVVSTDLLDFTDFSHLHGIIGRRWSMFEPALGDRSEFDVFMELMKSFRNPSSHSRDLVPYEQNLVLGIVGVIRNRVAMYRSSRGPDMKFYPEITQVTDSFGTKLSGILTHTDIVLRPGEVVTFKCVGTDPHDRELTWVMRTPDWHIHTSAQGDEVTLTWTVRPEHVRDHAAINIRMASSGPYWKNGDYDQELIVNYAVQPPAGAFPKK